MAAREPFHTAKSQLHSPTVLLSKNSMWELAIAYKKGLPPTPPPHPLVKEHLETNTQETIYRALNING